MAERRDTTLRISGLTALLTVAIMIKICIVQKTIIVKDDKVIQEKRNENML